MPDPDTSAVPPLRIHQREALEALTRAWENADHPRAWVVLPPGAGKTRVGLEAVAGELRAHPDTRAVVLAPNTAIQSQARVTPAALESVGSAERCRAQCTDPQAAAMVYQQLAVAGLQYGKSFR